MGTDPYLAVGDGYAVYQGGPLIDSGPHRHAAFQLAIAPHGDLSMVDEHGHLHRSAALLVPPMVRHRLLAVTGVLTFFVEPHCAFADRLRAHCGDGITAVPALRRLREEDLCSAGGHSSERIDDKLREAMDALTDPGLSMTDVAARVGVSPQRLRALAQRQLGMPLVRWRAWRRLARSAHALIAGQPLAEAAYIGGFADQAHFTRQMRLMMGFTPLAVSQALNPQGRRAT